MAEGCEGVHQKDGGQLHVCEKLLGARRDGIVFDGALLDLGLVFGIGDKTVGQPRRIADDELKPFAQHRRPVAVADNEGPDGILMTLDQVRKLLCKIPKSGEHGFGVFMLENPGFEL